MKTTFYTAEEMKHKIDKFIQQIIKSGITKNITMSEHFQNHRNRNKMDSLPALVQALQ